MRTTRRKFLTRAVALGAGAALAQVPGLAAWRVAHAATEAPTGRHPGVLYDLTKCAGCHLCEVACQANKGLPPDINLIKFKKADQNGPKQVAWIVRRQQCMHCLSPNCASACPVAAMYKTPEGPVIYRDERCLGCRYCMSACPFWVPQFDWDRGLLDQALIRKCDFCYQRQAEGKQPACVEACPTGAVTFGDRQELLASAHDLIAKNPDRYVDHVYGETEAGGTSWLLIAGVPFDQLGLPSPGNKPLPHISETVMKGTVPFALSWATVLTGLTYTVRWRKQRMDAKAGVHNDAHPAEQEGNEQ